MPTQEVGSERKGRFFKAVPAPASEAGQRSEFGPATAHAPPAVAPPPGPTGEAGAPLPAEATGDPETESLLGMPAGAGAPGRGGADGRGEDDVTKLTELLFHRGFSGLLDKAGRDDLAVIQTIFDANREVPAASAARPEVAANSRAAPSERTETDGMEARPPATDLAEEAPGRPAGLRPGSPAATPGTSITGETGRLALPSRPGVACDKTAAGRAAGSNKASEGGGGTAGGAQRPRGTVGGYPMRLLKLGARTSVTTTRRDDDDPTPGETAEGALDMVCRGTTKRPRRRHLAAAGALPTKHRGESATKWPCPCHLTAVRRRWRYRGGGTSTGTTTSTRAGSPMPCPRRPLPPIRRRHHSDICTVCPEVHDWKGLARNPRWYPAQRSTDSSSPPLNQPATSDTATSEVPVRSCQSLAVEYQGNVPPDEGAMPDTAEAHVEDDANWFPERSVPSHMKVNHNGKEPAQLKDGACAQDNSTVCDAVRNAHCPWLDGVTAASARRSLADGEPRGQIVDLREGNGSSAHPLEAARRLMDGMDFECDTSGASCDAFGEDGAILRAVILRSHALNHGTAVATDARPETPASSADGAGSADGACRRVEATSRRHSAMYDRIIPLRFCSAAAVQDRASCPSVGEGTKRLEMRRTEVSSYKMGPGAPPTADVVMTSRGQRVLVNSSLVAVGRGQTGESSTAVNTAKDSPSQRSPPSSVDQDALCCPRRPSPPPADDAGSSEALLRQEMARYVHSLRHERAQAAGSGRRAPMSSAGLNVPVRVQNLTAVRPITAGAAATSDLASRVSRAVGFIPILTREEYDGLCGVRLPAHRPHPSHHNHQHQHQGSKLPRAPALPPIVGRQPSDALLVKGFNGQVTGRQLARRRDRKK